jgi:hypothetical protein
MQSHKWSHDSLSNFRSLYMQNTLRHFSHIINGTNLGDVRTAEHHRGCIEQLKANLQYNESRLVCRLSTSRFDNDNHLSAFEKECGYIRND